MTSMILFMSACAGIALQFLSRNVFFVPVAAVCLFASVMVQVRHYTGRWYFCIPPVLANGVLLFFALREHLAYPQIADYLIVAVQLSLAILLTVLEMIPRGEEEPPEEADAPS